MAEVQRPGPAGRMSRDLPIIHSFGGGTQSVAIAVLVVQGKLPRPERIVIADTSREAAETWEYLERHVQPLLATVGLSVEVAPHSLSTVDLYGKNGDMLMPLYTAEGALPTFCSDKWKRRVIARWLRYQGYGPANPVITWIGISVDEISRAKPYDKKWQRYEWPLLGHPYPRTYRRHECRQIVLDAGLPEPPKSSCWSCPFRHNSQWRRLRDDYPADWQEAVALDESLRARDIERGGSGVYLHKSRRPLAAADLSDPVSTQKTLFDAEEMVCDSGHCFV